MTKATKESEPKAKKFSESYKYGQVRLRKRADNGVWYVRYTTLATGKDSMRSTGSTLKREAEGFCDKLTSEISNNKLGIADDSIPLEKLFDEFLLAKRLTLSAGTLKRLNSSKRNFEKWLKEFHKQVRSVKHVTPNIVREFQNYRVAVAGVSHRTIDNDVSNLNTIFIWGEKEGYVAKSPFNYSKKNGRVQLFKKPAPQRDTFTIPEYEALLVESTGIIKDLIVVLANTGLRFRECTYLKPECLVWDSEIPYIHICARPYFTPKDPHEVKSIPMAEDVQGVLKRLSEACGVDGYLFCTKPSGNPVQGNHALKRLQELFPKVGIDLKVRRVHWHAFRNYFIIKAIDANIPIRTIMSWVGHDSAKMVLHYASANTSDSIGFGEFKKLM